MDIQCETKVKGHGKMERGYKQDREENKSDELLQENS